MTPESTIICVDCGGLAHLLTTWPSDDPPQPGDVVSYRCADCWDRWDVVLPDPGPADPEPEPAEPEPAGPEPAE